MSYLTGKLSKLRSFDKQWLRTQNYHFQSFFTQNCAVHSGSPTVSSVYLPTPQWHNLKAHPFLAIHSADEHRMIYSFSNTTSYPHISRFLFFFSDNNFDWKAFWDSSQIGQTKFNNELTT